MHNVLKHSLDIVYNIMQIIFCSNVDNKSAVVKRLSEYYQLLDDALIEFEEVCKPS